jgi:hypothetical protein
MLFQALSTEDLLTVGVPSDWVEDVRQATEDACVSACNFDPLSRGIGVQN